MTFTKSAAALILTATFPLAAFAQHHGGNFGAHLDQRDAHLHQRIERGIRDGSLTQHEAAKLQRKHAWIERMEARARADGRVNRAERAHIIEVQNRLSAAIERKRSNHQRAWPADSHGHRGQHGQHANADHPGHRHEGGERHHQR